MSNSESESGKRINGWWRLWIVSSISWTISVLVYSTTAWFNDSLNYLRNQFEHIIYTLALMITPPIIIAALGKSIAWIVKGFKS